MPIASLFKQRLRENLLATQALTDLIGDRLYAYQAKQKTDAPYVVWTTVSGSQNHAHDGPTGLEEYRIQFNIYAKTSSECESIRDVVKTALDGLKTTWTGVRVGYCFFDNEVDFYEDTVPLKQKSIDFRFMVSAT